MTAGHGSGRAPDAAAAAPGGNRQRRIRQGGDRRGGAQGARPARQRRRQPAPANGAMAEALRRAGLVNDKGTPAKRDRRSERP